MFSIASRSHRAAFATALLVLAKVAAAQEPAPLPDTFFEDRVGVEVVSIDVVVTDSRGHPVLGLGAGDFELRIDGKATEITNFHAVQGRRLKPGPEPPEARPETSVAVGDTTLDEPLQLVLFFDNSHTAPGGRKRLVKELDAFVESQLAAGARIMVVAYDRSTRIVAPFTRDAEALSEALRQVAKLPASGTVRQRERSSVIHSIASIYRICSDSQFMNPCYDCWREMLQAARGYAEQVARERAASVSSLHGLIGSLSLLPGRKIVVYVSDGVQQQSGVDVFHFLGYKVCPQHKGDPDIVESQMEVDSSGQMFDLIAHANANRVSFYALETAGLRSFTASSAEWDDFRFRQDPETDQLRIANLQNTLFYVSRETGGREVLNANHFVEPLTEIADEMSTYYSLGYTPTHPGAGRTHRVQVKVPGQKGEVRYRTNYLHKAPEQLREEKTIGAFVLGVEENSLAVAVRTGKPEAREGGFVVPIELAVPYENLALLPYEDTRRGRLTLILAAPEENGRRTSIRQRKFEVAAPLDEAARAGEFFRMGIRLALPPGEHSLLFGVWDDVAETVSYLRLDVSLGP